MGSKPVNHELGTGFVTLRCPECGKSAEVVMTLSTRLTVEVESGSLRPVLKAKPVEHSCHGDTHTAPMFGVEQNGAS